MFVFLSSPHLLAMLLSLPTIPSPPIPRFCVQVLCLPANESVCFHFDLCQLMGGCDGSNTAIPQACNTSNTTASCITCTLPSTQTLLSSIQMPPLSIIESKIPASCPQIISQFANCSSSPPSLSNQTASSNDISTSASTRPFSATQFSATHFLTTPSSSDSSPVTTVPTPQSGSIMSPSPLQHTTAPTPNNHPRTTTSNAAAIAGGVVGGVLFLSLLTIGVLYFRRWRIQRRVAPSAEFMFLAGSGASYSRAFNESPPAEYLTRNTPDPDPVLEKAYRSAEAQRGLDSNDTSVTAWEHPV